MHALMQVLATIPFSVLVGVYFNLHLGSDLKVYRSEKLSRIMNVGDCGKSEREREREAERSKASQCMMPPVCSV